MFAFSLASCNEKDTNIFLDNANNLVCIKSITTDSNESECFGTGVILDDEGTILTNAHIVSYSLLGISFLYDLFYIKEYGSDEYVEATLITYDSKEDLALLRCKDLKTKDETKLLTFNSDKLNFNDEIYAIGNFNNYGLSLTKGIVSCPKIEINYLEKKNFFIQCDLTVSNGNSGGGLFNSNGDLIGLVTFRLRDEYNTIIQGICYCIPIERCLSYYESNKSL